MRTTILNPLNLRGLALAGGALCALSALSATLAPLHAATPSAVGSPAVADTAPLHVAVLDSTAPAAPATASPAAPAKAPPAKGVALEVGTGTVKFTGLLQAWYLDGDRRTTSSFRMRRAMLTFKGELYTSVHWTLSLDPAKALKLNTSYADVDGTSTVSGTSPNQATLMLQDAFLGLGGGRFRLDVGQFRLPLTYEGGSLSSSQMETVERAMFSTTGKLAQLRDVGAAAQVTLPGGVQATAGMFNGLGEGQNSTDSNAEKAVVGRVIVRLPIRGLHVGVSGAWGGEKAGNGRRQRGAAEAVYARGPVTLRGEAISAQENGRHPVGYYALAAYRHGRLQGVVRHDVWDPDTKLVGVAVRESLAGLNYFLPDAPVKVQSNFVRRTFASGEAVQSLILLGLQAGW